MYFQPGHYVVIEPLTGEHAPNPNPLTLGFSRDRCYEVLGCCVLDSQGEHFFWLVNDKDWLCLVSNRHLRYHATGSPGQIHTERRK